MEMFQIWCYWCSLPYLVLFGVLDGVLGVPGFIFICFLLFYIFLDFNNKINNKYTNKTLRKY